MIKVARTEQSTGVKNSKLADVSLNTSLSLVTPKPDREDRGNPILALKHYLMGDSQTTNLFLRTPTDEWLRSEYSGRFPREVMERRVALIDSGLKPLPVCRSVTYRGTFIPQEVLEKILWTRIYKDPAFFSTSRDGRVDFILPHYIHSHEGSQRVYFVIHGSSGRDVSSVAQSQEEKEVVFPRDTHFAVVLVRTKRASAQSGGGEYLEITLMERAVR